MSGKTVPSAILLLIIGNALALLSDVIIKLQDANAPIFQFILVRTLCTLTLLLPLIRQVDRTALLAGWKVHLLRAHISIFGIVCMIVALKTLPLATANAVFYAAPLLVMLLGVVFVGERLSVPSLVAVLSGFLGIVVILRPVAFDWASLSAVGVAFTLAIGVLLVRKLPAGQSTVHSLVLVHLMMLPTLVVLTLVEAAPWDSSLVLSAFGSAFFILCYQVTVLKAYRWVAANRVTSAEYTGLIWAILGGWAFFGEQPDVYFILGALMIVLPLLWLGWHEHRPRRKLRPQHELQASTIQ
ncbi:DMT family transporter [Saccharospirillum mangrovi]|uniref:DMT family transporter n=1 Tax=Saccharospirillum mangrovi TaxID=2161747 RepID=UPI000D377B9B|nr:DMT family transporter [Saccharospirillum mangrovi]